MLSETKAKILNNTSGILRNFLPVAVKIQESAVERFLSGRSIEKAPPSLERARLRTSPEADQPSAEKRLKSRGSWDSTLACQPRSELCSTTGATRQTRTRHHDPTRRQARRGSR